MDFEQDSSAATAPALEKQKLTSPATVEEPGGTATYPDLNSLLAALEHERIAALAYFYWQQRGCPEGSPDQDWFCAEQHVREGR